jgi:hypothetical protein
VSLSAYIQPEANIWRARMLSRRTESKNTRVEAAAVAYNRVHPPHFSNSEESEHTNGAGELSYIANFHKGLNHNGLGEVVPADYRALRRALDSGSPEAFEAIPLGLGRQFVNPQAGLAFDTQGADAQALTMPPAPRIDSAEAASEMAELYWMALLRDVRFSDFPTNLDVAAAASSLSSFSDFRGPKIGGAVTPDTLFRGFTPGDMTGPYVSQFLLKPITYGTLRIRQRQLTAVPNQDYMMDFAEWLAIQNGNNVNPSAPGTFDPVRRYIRNLRDLATYVHYDALYEAYLNACLILLDPDLGAPFDPGNPYFDSRTQLGFGTFGGPHILSLVTEVATRALKAVWYQKWFVHRRLRPEAMGGLIHNHLKGTASYPIHPEILATGAGTVSDRVRSHNLAKGSDSFLLPMAFREGSPTHPAYGAGHATVAGACVTILKAWFDESYVIPDPVVSNNMGTGLVPAPGNPSLTVGGELNKVAANIAIGRNMGGVHWRTDYTESVKLGEAIALTVLEEQNLCYNEFSGLSVTRFDGTRVTI